MAGLPTADPESYAAITSSLTDEDRPKIEAIVRQAQVRAAQRQQEEAKKGVGGFDFAGASPSKAFSFSENG